MTKGSHIGEKAHVDHLILVKLAAELEKSFANLVWLPVSQNQAKPAKYTRAGERRAKALNEEAGWELEN